MSLTLPTAAPATTAGAPALPSTQALPAGPSTEAARRPMTRLRRHAWLIVLAIGTLLFLAVERTMVATHNPNYVPTAILLGAAVVPAAFLAFVSGRRLPYSVPFGVVAGTAFFGGVLGTVVAGLLEYDTMRKLGGLPMLGIGVIEEASKLIAPLVLLLFLRQRSRADGLLIGVACGAGFAALETMGYAFVTMLRSGGNVTDTVDLLVLRGVLSPAGHMAWTGIAAAALYAAAASGWRLRKVLQFVLAFGVAVVLHALWDGFATLPAFAVLAVVSLGLLWFTAHRTLRSEVPA
jgi:protease PrsW